MNAPLTALIVFCVLADALYGSAAALYDAARAAWSPEAAFGWLKALVQTAACILLAWGARALWHYRTAADVLPLRMWRVFGMAVMLLFSLPSLGLWLHAFAHPHTLAPHNIRYLATAACQPILFVLCLHALWRQWRFHRRRTARTADTVYLPPRH